MKNGRALVKRIISFLLTLTLLLGCTPAAAAGVVLPAALTALEDEAFLGDYKLQGLVTLPPNLTSMGKNVFHATQVHALRIPAGVATLPEQGLAGAGYVWLESAETMASPGAFSGVKYLFSSAESAARAQAEADGAIFVDIAEIVEQDGFYYHVTSGKATLLCAVDGTLLPEEVKVPVALADGTPVTALGSDAMIRCSGITKLLLPAGIIEDATSLDGCPQAVVSYYSDTDFCVTYVRPSMTQVNMNGQVTWIARTNSTGTVEYYFEVHRLSQNALFLVARSDGFVSSAEYEFSNRFTADLTEPGEYVATVTCRDGQGNQCTASSVKVSVLSERLSIKGVEPDTKALTEGGSVTWTVAHAGGNGEILYDYTLLRDGMVYAEISDSAEDTYTLSAAPAGQWEILVVAHDDVTKTHTVRGQTVGVYTPEQARPAAPLLKDTLFGSTQDSVPTLTANTFALSWDAVSGAAQYGVTVDLQQNGAWTEVHHALTSGSVTQASIPLNLFAGLTEDTLCRFGVYSRNLETGDPRYYYAMLQPRVIDTTLTVDGQTGALTWYEGYFGEASKTFTVVSELPWTASLKDTSSWITVETSGQALTVHFGKNSMGGDYRSDVLTVSNGVSSVKIQLRHYCLTQPPAMSNLSDGDSASNPVELPMEAFNLLKCIYDGSVAMFVQEPQADGSYATVWQNEAVEDVQRFHPRAEGLKTGVTYRVVLTGYKGSYASTVNKDALTSYAYVTFRDLPDSVLIQEQSSYTAEIQKDLHVTVNYTGDVPVFSSDVSWLTWEWSERYNELTVTAEDNLSEEIRTGTITVQCGSASATLNIRQQSSYPVLLSPLGLSTDESSPTKIYRQKTSNTFRADADAMELEKLEDDEYTEVAEGEDSITIARADLSADTYRLTIWKGDYSRQYYFKVASSTTAYITLAGTAGEDTDSLTEKLFAEAGTLTVTVKSSGKWTAVSNSDWITLSAASGSSSSSGKEITVSVAANPSDMSRMGSITFQRSTYQTATLTVIQQGTAPTSIGIEWDDGTTSLTTSGTEHAETIYIHACDDWSAAIDADWISFNSNKSVTTMTGIGTDSLAVYLDEHTVGSAPRSAVITLTNGKQTCRLSITQHAMPLVDIQEPDFSHNKSNPTIFVRDDMTLSWIGDDNVGYYVVDTYLHSEEQGAYGSTYTIPHEAGRSRYSMTLPVSAFGADTDIRDSISVYAYAAVDPDDFEVSTIYFKTISGEGAMINDEWGEIWDTASDLGDERNFDIRASSTWTAYTDASWLSLNKTTGDMEDTLTVTAAPNYGAKRTGMVYVVCGERTSTLQVEQYAYLPHQPAVNAAMSRDMFDPTILPVDTTSIELTWQYMEQVDEYSVSVLQVNDTSARNHQWSSDGNDQEIVPEVLFEAEAGSGTVSGLSLKAGQLYVLSVYQSLYDHGDPRNTEICYYFMAQPEGDPWVLVDDETSVTDENDSTWGSTIFDVDSNAVWTAHSHADWLMVHKEDIREYELNEEGKTTADYSLFTSNGTRLRISYMPNDTNETREGRVTVTVPGGNEVTVIVVQLRGCTAAELISPSLTSKSSAPAWLPYEALSLRWTESPDGAGEYTLTMSEKLPDEKKFYQVYDKTTTGTALTIPLDELTPNADYRLLLETWVDDTYTVSNTYYFHTNFENALTVTADVDWRDDYVLVTANASGGSGSGYEYSFALYRDGELISGSSWHDSQNEFGLSMEGGGSGKYEVEVVISDSEGQEQRFILAERTIGPDEIASYITLGQTSWNVGADGGSLTLPILSSGAWVCQSNADWLVPAKTSASDGSVLVTAQSNTGTASRMAKLSFNCGDAKASIAVVQSGTGGTEESSSISLSETDWSLASPGASMLEVKVASSDGWIMSECPSWIILSATSGSPDAMVSLYAQANTGVSRSGVLTLHCGNATASLTIFQPGTDVPPVVNGFTMSPETPSVGDTVTFTVKTSNADSVQLMVDSECYETYAVEEDQAVISRTFSRAGSRNVQFIPIRGSASGAACEGQTLTVIQQGKLASPVVNEVDPVIIGSGTAVSWQTVPNAESYTVYLYYGQHLMRKEELDADVTTLTLNAADLPYEGSYTLLVMASAMGWGQSEAGLFVDVLVPRVDFNVASPSSKSVYVPKDTVDVKVDNPSGYNIAIRITDSQGNVTYLPEGRETVSDTWIEGQLLYAPTAAGEVTIQAMAWPTERRTADTDAWFDPDRAVTFTVNGPLATLIYLGGNSSAASLRTSDVTTLTVKANNAAETLQVLLDDEIISVTKDGAQTTQLTYDSEKNYVRTFTCELPAATEGFHRYTAQVADGEGRTHSRTYSLYLVTPASGTRYPASNGVLMRATPSTPDSKAAALTPAAELTVLGTYGSYYYVSNGDSRGYVLKTDTVEEQIFDLAALEIIPVNPSGTYTTYAQNEDITFMWKLKYLWDSDFKLPEGTSITLCKKAADTDTWKDVATTTENSLTISPSKLGAGDWCFGLSLRKDGEQIASRVMNCSVYVYATAAEFLTWYQNQTEGTEFSRLARTIKHQAAIHASAHYSFLDGYYHYLTGEWKEGLHLDEYVESAAFQFYYNAFGEGLCETNSDSISRMYVIQAILDDLAPAESQLKPSEIADKAQGLVNMLNLGEEFVDTLVEVLEEYGQNAGKVKDLSKFLDKVDLNLLEEFAKTKDDFEEVEYLVDALLMYVRYTSIDKAKLTKVADGLMLSSNSNMDAIGQILLDLRNPVNVGSYCLGLIGMDVGRLVKDTTSNAIMDFVGGLGWVGKLYKTAVEGALAFNELAFNTNATQEASIALLWRVETLDDYIRTFEAATSLFLENPIEYYEKYLHVCDTFYDLLELEYEAFADYCESVDKAGWSKMKKIFSKNDKDLSDAASTARSFADTLRGYMSTGLDAMYNECLKRFGLKYIPLID